MIQSKIITPTRKFRNLLLLATILLVMNSIPLKAESEDPQSTAATNLAQQKFFETEVRPLLIKKCINCHGPEKQKGKLRLDRIADILHGGETGPALEPHKPDESLLVEAIRYESYEMPPDGKLSEREINVFTKWVELGAPWPGGDRTARPSSSTDHSGSTITEEDRAFWSFQPLANPAVPEIETAWSRNEIDPFILRKLNEHQLTPSPQADRATLIRRLYFDLIGLPPSAEAVDAFVQNDHPDAYEMLVNELLNSPRYGEHWARFWLDLVRYAESDGFRKDDYRPEAWRYRDYVINAFNTDKPYFEFVAEQIAGDELAPGDPDALIATGFLRHGIYEYNQRDARTQWKDMLNDITDTVGDTFLGVGMGCARCHDHKFDPILQKDYFRLQAFFANISIRDDRPVVSEAMQAEYAFQLKEWETATTDLRAQLSELEQAKRDELAQDIIVMFPDDIQAIVKKPIAERSSAEQQLAHLVDRQVVDKLTTLATKFRGSEKKKWERLTEQLKEFDDLKPAPLPTGLTVRDYESSAPPTYIPSKERLGEIAPGFLTIFESKQATIDPLPELPQSSGRRATLATWLTRDDHPLTSRVIVNRIWKEHFGTGIVATTSDFGHLGEKPSHPELLDWLARDFVDHGWSIKSLHRKIVLSATYQQTSLREDHQATTIDPSNRFLWRHNIRRLNAEQIRDATLQASGELKHQLGGAPAVAATSKRRSIYTKIMRNQQDPFLAAFDLPDRMSSIGTRNTTTTPTQSLLLINGKWPLARATELALSIGKNLENAPAESQVRAAFRRTLSRDPNVSELSAMAEFLRTVPVNNALSAKIVPDTPLKEVALEIGTGKPIRSIDTADLPTETFSIRATFVLRSLYPFPSVRTIASQWDGNTKHPGWSLGVTSEKSSFDPRNVIFQVVGKNGKGERTYEVVPSNLRPELNQPYEVTVSVNLADTSDTGVQFQLKNITTGEIQHATGTHNVIEFEANDIPFFIGGRGNTKSHQWDGFIGKLVLDRTFTPVKEAKQVKPLPSEIYGHWNFASPSPTIDLIHNRKLFAGDNPTTVSPALVDVCHVLFNMNSFLYVD